MILTYLFLILFSIAVLLIGFINLFRVKTPEDYFVAGRHSGTFLTSGSFTATIIGGSSTMGLAGLAFSKGLVASWWLLVGVIGLLVLIPFVKKIKSYTVFTLPELVGKWYGERVRKLTSLLIALAWTGIVSAQIIAAAKLLTTVFPNLFPHNSIMLFTALIGTVFVLYTLAGGQVSVIKTDFIQSILIVIGITGAFLFGLIELGKISNASLPVTSPGTAGITGAGVTVGLHHLKKTLKPAFFSFPISNNFSLKDLAIMILVVGSTYTIGPDMISRIFCTKDEGSARRAILTSVAVLIPLAFIITMVGIEAKALFPTAKPEQSFPLMINNILPPIWAALTVTALISAFLSSADTTLLTLSAIVSLDVLNIKTQENTEENSKANNTPKNLEKNGQPKSIHSKLLKYRLITLLAGIVSIGIALFSGGIIKSLLLSYTLFAGALTVPIILALMGKPLRETPTIIVIITGGIIALYGRLTGKTWLILAGFALALIIAITDRMLTYKKI